MKYFTHCAILARATAACLLAGLLASCGGGGSETGGCTTVDPNRPSALPGCGTTVAPTPPTTPPVVEVPAQIAFVSATPKNLALTGTGGPGRQETSTLVFKVMSSSGAVVPGAMLDFALFGLPTGAGTGGITLSPSSAVSSSDGTVSMVVMAGTVNTPVRIIATVRGVAPVISVVSDELVVSTGIPDQNSMSLSTEIFNLEGWSHDGCEKPVGSKIRVSLGDHFNNPVPDGTAVSFTAEGGTVDASCTTLKGICSVDFCASNPRPADGRITIMAYALGEESYTENSALPNSINRYDLGELYDDLCEPFRDDFAVMFPDTTVKDSKSSACPIPRPAEIYIDTNGDGRYNATGDGAYNGVLNVDPATGKTTANNRSSTVHVRQSLVLVLSNSSAAVSIIGSNVIELDKCVNGHAFANTPVSFNLAIRDNNPTTFPGNPIPGNILPAGTKINVSATNGTVLGDASYTVVNTSDTSYLNWLRAVVIRSDATQTGAQATPAYVCTDTVKSGIVTVTVETPMGIKTQAGFSVND